jgi:hypothetical protein
MRQQKIDSVALTGHAFSQFLNSQQNLKKVIN